MKCAVSVLVLGSLMACSSNVVHQQAPAPAATTPPETQPDETPDGTCQARLDGDCGTCMKTSCCDALMACEGDANCTACVTGKDSDACEKTTGTHERVDAYLTCKGGSCASSCIETTDAGTCTGLLDSLVTAKCAACMVASCCEQVASCHGAAVCWDGCYNNHDETKCHGDPDAHALYHAMGSCQVDFCDSACSE